MSDEKIENELDNFGTAKNMEAQDRRIHKGEAPTPVEVEKRACDSMTPSHMQWVSQGHLRIPAGKTQPTLESGFYTVAGLTQQGEPILSLQPINVDEMIRFTDTIQNTILKEIEEFWKLKDAFTRYGYLHRRGIMLYGAAGGGKSVCIQQICKDIIDRGGLVLNCNCRPEYIIKGLESIREIEPERQLVCLFEDIDAIISTWGESSILSILDGENQVANVLNVASTNYPERLDRRIVARPRRFDRLYNIGYPPDITRREYFSYKVKDISEEELNTWVALTKDFSFAALTEFIISIKCLGNPVESTATKLRQMMSTKTVSTDDPYKTKAGFTER